jgi:hypothetical protein
MTKEIKPEICHKTGHANRVCGNCNSVKFHPSLIHVFDGEDILFAVCNNCGYQDYIVRLTDILSEYIFKDNK